MKALSSSGRPRCSSWARPRIGSADGSIPSRTGLSTLTATSTIPTSARRSATSAHSIARWTPADAYVLDRDVLLDKVRETVALGGDQILMQGGLHPHLKLEWYEELLRDIKAHFPGVNVHGFSPPEIHHFTKVAKLPLT